MTTALDLTGKKFGILTAINRIGTKDRQALWLCKCECGNEKIIKASSLNTNKCTSCGCLRGKKIAESNIKNKTTHNKSGSRIYWIWSSMIERCTNKKNKQYKHYGDRGIKVCEEWRNSFENFYKDMGDRPINKSSLGRIDNDKGYYKENCRWETYNQQANNKRNNKRYIIGEENLTLKQISEKYNINYGTLKSRINESKMPIDIAISMPPLKNKRTKWQKLINKDKEILQP
jgi:hypothetical protein